MENLKAQWEGMVVKGASGLPESLELNQAAFPGLEVGPDKQDDKNKGNGEAAVALAVGQSRTGQGQEETWQHIHK